MSKILTKKRILLIDDEPFNVLSMQLTLGRLGIKGLSSIIDRAYNGLEAVDKVKDALNIGTHVYGLIITDISMPVMDGWDAIKVIKGDESTKSIPVIALSAHAMEEHRERAMAAGADDYDTKPVDLERLLGKINNQLLS